MTIKVFDNQGKTRDRYTVVVADDQIDLNLQPEDVDIYGFSEDALGLQGFNQFLGNLSEFGMVRDALAGRKEKKIGREVQYQELPAQVLAAILDKIATNN